MCIRDSTYAGWERLKEKFEDQELVGVMNWVEDLRMIKNKEEVEYISKAQQIAEKAFKLLMPVSYTHLDVYKRQHLRCTCR